MDERPHITAARAHALVIFLGLVTTVPTAQTQKPAYGTPLEGTYWRAVELAGKPVPPRTQNARHIFCSMRQAASPAPTDATGSPAATS